VLIWRRSYDVPPPGGESLKDTLARTLPYYVQEILPCVLRGQRTLVAAHGNSLRALIMVLEKLTPEQIQARTRHRRAGGLSPQRGRDRGVGKGSGGVSDRGVIAGLDPAIHFSGE
jgi:broad specificity phosphatase PhoE